MFYYFILDSDAFITFIIALARTFNPMFNKNGKSWYPCLDPDSKEKLSAV